MINCENLQERSFDVGNLSLALTHDRLKVDISLFELAEMLLGTGITLLAGLAMSVCGDSVLLLHKA